MLKFTNSITSILRVPNATFLVFVGGGADFGGSCSLHSGWSPHGGWSFQCGGLHVVGGEIWHMGLMLGFLHWFLCLGLCIWF